MSAKYVPGTMLTEADQKHVLAAYVYRHTRDHVPAWARGLREPVQFGSDREWLEHTDFAVRKDGRLDARVTGCLSYPTWPDGRPARRASRAATEMVTTEANPPDWMVSAVAFETGTLFRMRALVKRYTELMYPDEDTARGLGVPEATARKREALETAARIVDLGVNLGVFDAPEDGGTA